MADMLSNTVGIMLFILALTILQTAGVLIPKRLPMVRNEDNRRPIFFVCQGQRLIPLDPRLSDKLFNGLGRFNYDNADSWVARFNKGKAEDAFFAVLPDGKTVYNRSQWPWSVSLDLACTYKPKPNVGDTVKDLQLGSSIFHKRLRSAEKSKQFLYLIVYPDNIEVFRKAREQAEIRYGIGCGWGPLSESERVRFNLSGDGGIVPESQD